MNDFVFKKKFGQNFISDKNLLNAIVDDAKITPDSEVLEIGAGAGSLTSILSQKAKKVVSFEIDNDLKPQLLALNLENVEFVFEDFLKMDMDKIEKLFSKNFSVIANLPYYITTPIIFKLLENSQKLDSLTIMVQKEVAERVVSQPGGKEYGILSVMVALYGDAKISRTVGRQMFFPMPNVDSAVLNIVINRNKFDVDKEKFSKFVKLCFSMRRKTLLNNLGQAYEKDKLKKVLGEEICRARSERFSIEELIEIFKKCEKI